MIHGIQSGVMWSCLALLGAMGACVLLQFAADAAKRAKLRLRGASLVMLALSVACILFGGRKGSVTVSDPYIVNAGSYLTNDVAHVAIAKRTPLLPDSTEILVYARPTDSTNVEDWVRLEPHLTFADHPYDYSLANATNYDVVVAANFTPEPTIHTNGVWQARGFMIPGTGRAAFPNTKVIKKEDQ